MSQLTRREVLRRGIAAGMATAGAGVIATVTGAPELTAAAQVTTQTERYRPLNFLPFSSDLDALNSERTAELNILIVGATVLDLQAMLGNGDVTSEELTLYFLNRVRIYDDMLRSFIELNPTALEDARAADRARASGSILGPLAGIPVSLKDNIETAAPMHTTAGAIVLSDNIAAADSPLVMSLRAAGAVILGKASLTEFAGAVGKSGANAMSGQGVNPYGRMFPSAGSSSGSAISTSSYLSALSVGTETSGSLITPSSVNGVVGMKPSSEVVSSTGVIPLIHFNDTPGPIGRSVTDVAVLLSSLDFGGTDYVSSLQTSALNGVTVAVLREEILAQRSGAEISGDTLELLKRIDAGLLIADAISIDARLMAPEGYDDAFFRLLLAGAKNEIPGYLATANAPAKTLKELIAFNNEDPSVRIPNGQQFLEWALNDGGSEAEYDAWAAEISAMAVQTLHETFESSGARLLVSISNLHSPIYSSAGYPAITIPLGRLSTGMPAGATLIGKLGEDVQLIAAAFAFEQATNLRVEPDLDALMVSVLAASEASPEAAPAS